MLHPSIHHLNFPRPKLMSICSTNRSKADGRDDAVVVTSSTVDKGDMDPNASWNEHELQLMWTWGCCHQTHETGFLLGQCPKTFFWVKKRKAWGTLTNQFSRSVFITHMREIRHFSVHHLFVLFLDAKCPKTFLILKNRRSCRHVPNMKPIFEHADESNPEKQPRNGMRQCAINGTVRRTPCRPVEV